MTSVLVPSIAESFAALEVWAREQDAVWIERAVVKLLITQQLQLPSVGALWLPAPIHYQRTRCTTVTMS